MEILFVFGSGGHEAQIKRIIKMIEDKKIIMKKICLCESDCKYSQFDRIYTTEAVRDKYQKYLISFSKLVNAFKLIILTIRILRENRNLNGMVSTGPGVVIIPAIIFRICRKKVVYLETWSRFYSKSITGFFMEKISSLFIVQNKELNKLYKKSEYGGRL